MQRRNFVKKLSILSSGVIFATKANAITNMFNKTSAVLKAIPNTAYLKNTTIQGTIYDAITHKPITATMHITLQGKQIPETNMQSNSLTGNYEIHTGVNFNNMHSTILEVSITAPNYKTYVNKIFANTTGCSIYSNAWAYNPAFNKLHLPVNHSTDIATNTTLNFYLLKK
jgi:hypothetical protein